MKTFGVAMLVLGMTGCVSSASESGTTGQVTDEGPPQPFNVAVLTDFTPDPANTAVHGISSWSVRLSGDAEGRMRVVVSGGDLDGLLSYTLERKVYDPTTSAPDDTMQISLVTVDGREVSDVLDEDVRAALSSDFNAMVAALQPQAQQVNAQSLRTQTGASLSNVSMCAFPLVATGLTALSTGVLAVVGFSACAGVTVITVGTGVLSCGLAAVGALAGVGATAAQAKWAYQCLATPTPVAD